MGKRGKQHRKTLKEHLAIVFRQEFCTFWGKFWKELLIGCGLDLATLLIGIGVGTSIKADFDEHPVATSVILFLPVSVVIGDLIWRFLKACRRLYRERDHESFRSPVHAGMVMATGWIFLISLCWWIDYESSPHFSGRLNSRDFHVSQYGPNLTMWAFESVAITNTGIPGNITNWELHIHTLGGQTFIGGENVVIDRNHPGKDFMTRQKNSWVSSGSGSFPSE
jgi:hypothetical protein